MASFQPTATPMRQIPGAFVATPAPIRNDPVRRRLFSETASLGSGGNGLVGTTTGGGSNSNNWNPAAPPASSMAGSQAVVASHSGTGQLQPAASAQTQASAPEVQLSPLAKAALSINQVLDADAGYPDLDSYCRPGFSSDYDLPANESAWAPFQRTQMYPLPDRILERLNASDLNVKMGLLPEISHAWAYIDNALFLWDYTHPSPDIIGYEESSHPLTAVALVRPKAGVFVNTITHVLVVASTADIVLLGVSATNTPSGATTIELYQTKMSVHRGGSEVSVIVGTATGRIFFGGITDTDIHELYYQQEEKWFSSRCGRINHTNPGWSSVVPSLPDNISLFGGRKRIEGLTSIVIDDTRNLVYSLSTTSTIRTYHMEAPDKLSRVIEKEKTQCLRDTSFMTPTPSPLLTDRMSIVSICPISATESSRVYLMALTSTGCRLFLSATNSASYMLGASSRNTPPQSMQVQFIKFPPSRDASLGGRRSSGEKLVTGSGTSDSNTDLQSRLLDVSAFGQRFAPGYFLDVVRKEYNPNTDLIFVSAPEAGRIKGASPTSALKYFEHGNWVDVIGGGRVLAIALLSRPFAASDRPMGFGNELAVQFDDAPSEFAALTTSGVHLIRRRRFVDIFAAAIRGAIGDEGIEKETRRFISLYGRVETVSAALAVACGQGSDLRTGTGRAIDQATEDRARSAFVEYGGKPTVPETDGAQITAASVRLSSRHDALALYLGRLIRQLWRTHVVTLGIDQAGAVVVGSRVPTSKLVAVQENVERLRRFLDANRGVIQGLSGPSDLQRVASRQEEIALQTEHQALHSLQRLMESVSEGISFVLMLFEERVADIYMRLDDESRASLRDLRYDSLFSQGAGKNLAKLLVKAIVSRNIESGSNVETVADALRRRCGSFCSPDDVVIFKAQEQLQRATEQTQNPNAARTLLNESLRLFERVAGSLTYANLRGAVDQFVGLKYFAGAIQLCLVVAREKDRGNSALSWINDGRPPADPRKRAFDERKRCYDLIHEAMQKLDAASSAEPEMVDGRPTLTATKRVEAYNVVNGSDDEVFHFDLYEWYIEQDWTDRILAIESPHVVTFLQRLAATDARHADLLCRFYTHRSRFFDAASVQADLAKSDFAIGIKDRITLLSRAKGNASVTTTGVNRQEQQLLNHEVSELLEIAHIQDDLLERLKADHRIPAERKVEVEQALDGPILDLSELFNTYADQAGYYDLCLLIYHAADYHNPRVIEDTWTALINNTNFDIEQRQQMWKADKGAANRAAMEGPPPQPYEMISAQIQTIAHRTSLDSLIFPIDALLPAVCRFALEKGQDASIGADPAWPVILFLQLGVAHALVVRVLERVLDAQEAPFTARRRKYVVQWIDVAVESWVREVERRGGAGGRGGEAAMGAWVSELLGRAEQTAAQVRQGARGAAETEELEMTQRKTIALRRAVDAILTAAVAQARLGFN